LDKPTIPAPKPPKLQSERSWGKVTEVDEIKLIVIELEKTIFSLCSDTLERFKKLDHLSPFIKNSEERSKVAYWTTPIRKDKKNKMIDPKGEKNVKYGSDTSKKYIGKVWEWDKQLKTFWTGSSKSGFVFFLHFCQSEFSAENPLFLAACDEIKTQTTKERLINFYINMCEDFVLTGSEREVNVSFKERNKAAKLYKKYKTVQESYERRKLTVTIEFRNGVNMMLPPLKKAPKPPSEEAEENDFLTVDKPAKKKSTKSTKKDLTVEKPMTKKSTKSKKKVVKVVLES